jgi:hypothetical protein
VRIIDEYRDAYAVWDTDGLSEKSTVRSSLASKTYASLAKRFNGCLGGK